MKKILIILTSHKELDHTDGNTGVWLGEFTDPYYEFIDAGYQVTLASPAGGEPPIDPRSKLTEAITASNRRFQDDPSAQAAFRQTIPLSQVRAEEYDALFLPGGHGPMWDLAESDTCADIVLNFYDSNKPIGAVCHGPAGLVKAAERQPSLLQGRKVTAFTNLEERLVFLYNNIPFKLEDRLKKLGARFNAATIPFTSQVHVDGQLVTGQNPASAEGTARALIGLLEKVAV